jgi:hypothetical protein
MVFSGMAQEKKFSVYSSFSTEMIFSFASVNNGGNEQGVIMRWAPVFNPQWMINFDMNRHVGFFTGFAIRNVGYIYDDPNDPNKARFKYRTYNAGFPIGFKVGNMKKFMFFGGYEVEFPFVYKEKKFVNEAKTDKTVIWFTSRVEPIQHGFMAGVQFPAGATLKFKYYLSNFHNRNYTAMVDGEETKPYDYKANVFYFSLAWNLFGNWRDIIPKN